MCVTVRAVVCRSTHTHSACVYECTHARTHAVHWISGERIPGPGRVSLSENTTRSPPPASSTTTTTTSQSRTPVCFYLVPTHTHIHSECMCMSVYDFEFRVRAHGCKANTFFSVRTDVLPLPCGRHTMRTIPYDTCVCVCAC